MVINYSFNCYVWYWSNLNGKIEVSIINVLSWRCIAIFNKLLYLMQLKLGRYLNVLHQNIYVTQLNDLKNLWSYKNKKCNLCVQFLMQWKHAPATMWHYTCPTMPFLLVWRHINSNIFSALLYNLLLLVTYKLDFPVQKKKP